MASNNGLGPDPRSNPLRFATAEVRATRGRRPLALEVARADAATSPPGLADAMVVYVEHDAAPRALAALARRARTKVT